MAVGPGPDAGGVLGGGAYGGEVRLTLKAASIAAQSLHPCISPHLFVSVVCS